MNLPTAARDAPAFTIRRATRDDLPAINEIYNQAVLRTTGTFDTEPKSLEDRRAWFDAHHDGLPVLVYEAGGAVIGWVSLSRYSDRAAYDAAAEISIYVDETQRGRGAGGNLMAALAAAVEGGPLRTIIARIATENAASVRLHERAGFATAGILRSVGEKFGRLLDVTIMQRMLK